MQEISKKNIFEYLSLLEFKLLDGEENMFSKMYGNYEIKIKLDMNNFSSSKIDYGDKIKVHRKTTCNFSQQENFVVLECINKLLEKGYSPESLELEKKWRVGGFLDIFVKDKEGESFLMIECKTFGKEFDIAEKKLLFDGDQLFSYYHQEKNTKYLCLYASQFDNNEIVSRNNIIETKEDMKDSANKETAFEKWDKIMQNKGLFEEKAKPYFIDFEEIRELQKVDSEISDKLYYKFATILRKHAISDKTNAYNKLFNLFLCKIVDEDRATNKEYHFKFQWKREDDFKIFLGRLSDLYKEGVEDYLDLEVTDYSEEEIEQLLTLLPKNKKYKLDLKKIYEELRLYKNNEFAFKEVYNEETFNQNALIVKEIVELFQNLQIRYNQRQQFLGDFFEKLLNTGIKQEQGQFFTPSPITSFISKSLPLKDIMVKKNENKESHILPYVIDYACGSGHFLTEIMGEIQKHLNYFNDSNIKGGRIAVNTFNRLKEEYGFAEEYIYGIEKDYRLAKTAKVSTIINGDGLANIYCDDGLNKFNNYKESYKKLYSNSLSKDNLNFDVVVANPPYSVEDFKENIEEFGNESFELYAHFGDKAKAIECLFIERTKQLLKDGGVAGIILPDSILNNSGNLYSKTREFIFKNFEIKGIVRLGVKTFMDTNIKTIILFLKKRDSFYFENIKDNVIKSFEGKRDLSINQISNPIQKYLQETYEIDFDDFKTLLNYKPNEKIIDLDMFEEYNESFDTKLKSKIKKTKEFIDSEKKENFLNKKLIEYIIEKEKEKIIFYLIYGKKVCIVKIPKDLEEQEAFLGYKISRARGKEGIDLEKDENYNIISDLYNETNVFDKSKVNYYLLNSFCNSYPEINDNLNKIVSYEDLVDLMDFNSADFNKQIMLDNKVDWMEVWDSLGFSGDLEKLRINGEILKGTSITKSQTSKGDIPVIAGGKGIAYYHNVSNREGNIISISASGKNAGYIWYHKNPLFASDCLTITSLNENEVPVQYLSIILKYLQKYVYKLQRGNAQPHIYRSDLKKILIPKLDETKIKKIILDVEELDKQKGRTEEYYYSKIKEIVENTIN